MARFLVELVLRIQAIPYAALSLDVTLREGLAATSALNFQLIGTMRQNIRWVSE
jgi:hypothetical protein